MEHGERCAVSTCCQQRDGVARSVPLTFWINGRFSGFDNDKFNIAAELLTLWTPPKNTVRSGIIRSNNTIYFFVR